MIYTKSFTRCAMILMIFRLAIAMPTPDSQEENPQKRPDTSTTEPAGSFLEEKSFDGSVRTQPTEREPEDVSCVRAPADSGKGPTRAELIDFLVYDDLWHPITERRERKGGIGASTSNVTTPDDFNPEKFLIDKFGCHQIACIGDRGVLSLCNMQSARPSFVEYPLHVVYYALKTLETRWSQLIPYLQDWDGVSQREEYVNWQAPMRLRELQVFPYPERTCSTYWFPEGHDGLDELIMGTERITGELFTLGGWRISVDEPVKEKCDPGVKFRSHICMSDVPSTCTWDYTKGEP